MLGGSSSFSNQILLHFFPLSSLKERGMLLSCNFFVTTGYKSFTKPIDRSSHCSSAMRLCIGLSNHTFSLRLQLLESSNEDMLDCKLFKSMMKKSLILCSLAYSRGACMKNLSSRKRSASRCFCKCSPHRPQSIYDIHSQAST